MPRKEIYPDMSLMFLKILKAVLQDIEDDYERVMESFCFR